MTELVQSAGGIFCVGQQRKAELCKAFISSECSASLSREEEPPVCLTKEEQLHYDDRNKSLRRIRNEINLLMQVIPDSDQKTSIHIKLRVAKKKDDFIDCLKCARTIALELLHGDKSA